MHFFGATSHQAHVLACLGIFWAALTLAGCSPGSTGSDSTVTAPPPETAGHDDHSHQHPSEGPHHGDLVELGNEEYHAEIVHGDAGSVTVYVLDGAATSAVPIDAPELTINITHDNKPEQFKLAAAPEPGEPQGKSSKFVIADEKLAKLLDESGVSARLVLTISGKQYTGTIEHTHDHEGHDHQHK